MKDVSLNLYQFTVTKNVLELNNTMERHIHTLQYASDCF